MISWVRTPDAEQRVFRLPTPLGVNEGGVQDESPTRIPMKQAASQLGMRRNVRWVVMRAGALPI